MTFEAKKDKYIKCPCTECNCVLHIWVAVENHVCESCADLAHEYSLRNESQVKQACEEVRSEGMYYIGNFLAGYIDALFKLEPENDEGETESGELGIFDIAPEAWSRILGDIELFKRQNEEELDEWYEAGGSLHDAGANFFLDRNGHGAGFRDLGNDYDRFEKLANSASAFGEQNIGLGDDKKLYVQ